jgi:hypothetical protein
VSPLIYDPIPWLMRQESQPALRARRLLALEREEDAARIRDIVVELAGQQEEDGSFAGSPMRTAGVLNLLSDLRVVDVRVSGSETVIAVGVEYLLSVLESQPGYERARDVAPGSLTAPCDLCGFFGPYEARNLPQVMAYGADEMNALREYEPLLGPQSPVRGVRRSSLDRAGPASCYSWGLIPLAYSIEALCRAGHARDERLQPAIQALLGAQRASGGWCRNLGGDLPCTVHPLRALGAHPDLRRSVHGVRVLRFMRAAQGGDSGSKALNWWRGANLYAALQAVAAYEHPIAVEILSDGLANLASRQRKNGTFGTPHRVERVTAALIAVRALSRLKSRDGDPSCESSHKRA